MFSFFSKTGVKCILVCLLAALVLAGCKTDPGFDDDHVLDPKLIASWSSFWGDGASDYDGYIITGTHVKYDSGGIIDYEGDIVYVSNFSSNAGVIIIKYDSPRTYYDGEFDNDGNWVSTGTHESSGDYTGIFYRELTSGTVEMGTAYDAEETTPYRASAAFTKGNEGNYIWQYGVYTKDL